MPPSQSPARRCDRCNARLASYNRSARCAPCSAGAHRQPPQVPREFWDLPEMRDALATLHMGRVVYVYRNHPWHGQVIKQSVVAGWFGLTQTQLSRIENHQAPEEISKLVRWAKLLGIPAELRWFKVPGEELQSLPARIVPVIFGGWEVLLPVDEQAARACGLGGLLDQLPDAGPGGARPGKPPLASYPMRPAGGRVLGLTVGDAAELERLAAALDDARRYLDGSVVGLFRRQLEQSKAEDGRSGPATALPFVLGILSAVTDHVREVKPDVRRELLSLGAEGAEFAGWLYRDLKDPGSAAYWYDRAMEWAQQASDLPMQGYVLLRKSQMAYDTPDAHQVVTFAEAAHDGPWRCTGTIRAEIAQQHALGLAMTGAPLGTVEREMAVARELLATAQENDDPAAGGGTFTLETLLLRQATCYTEAGRPATAAQQFRQVIGSGALSRRDTGFFGARRALALALSGEPDEASAAGLEAARIAHETSSERTMRLLSEVVQELKPWSTRPQVRELRQAVTAAPR
jgi:transcriptional regulator with XRE-family HTH domain